MNFHESRSFGNAIEAAAEMLNLRPVLIEKDYWVTYVLKNLAHSPYASQVVFKGGTSLSKAYRCIDRFSEDIDLAVILGEPLSQAQIKNLLRNIDHAAADGLTFVEGKRWGRNRVSIYDYPKFITGQNFGAVKDKIAIEINTFTNPVPHAGLPISSYLYHFLLANGNADLIQQYQLEPFPLNVLSLERTFFEKLLSLNRLSYDGLERLKEKIRHFYDLHELYHKTSLKETVLNDSGFEVLALVRADDEAIPTFAGEWLGKPFASSPLFATLPETWKSLIPTYQQELGELVWSTLPDPSSVYPLLELIKEFLQRYDEQFYKR